MLDDLQMLEAVGNYTGKKIGATFFRGTKPIDGVWVTSDVVIIGACVMPAGYGSGDYRLFALEFITSSLIGHAPPKIVRAAARHLNTNILSGELYYVNSLEELITKHKIVEILVLGCLAAALTILGGSCPIKDDVRNSTTKRR